MAQQNPELVEMMPVASQAVRAEMDRTTPSQSLGALLSRAALVGACAGLMIIGLWENVSRFSEPETLASVPAISLEPASAMPLNIAPAALNGAQRGDRLATHTSNTAETDLALR